MSIVRRSDDGNSPDTNLITAKGALTVKLQEISPVVEFYRELLRGWSLRLQFASSALKQIPHTDKRNRLILTELIEVAGNRKAEASKSFNEATNIKLKLEEKIQDLDFISLKSVQRSGFKEVDIGINDINRLLYVSDALLELRSMENKEITL